MHGTQIIASEENRKSFCPFQECLEGIHSLVPALSVMEAYREPRCVFQVQGSMLPKEFAAPRPYRAPSVPDGESHLRRCAIAGSPGQEEEHSKLEEGHLVPQRMVSERVRERERLR